MYICTVCANFYLCRKCHMHHDLFHTPDHVFEETDLGFEEGPGSSASSETSESEEREFKKYESESSSDSEEGEEEEEDLEIESLTTRVRELLTESRASSSTTKI